MSKQDAGGMPTGRRKRGGLGGKKLRKKIEVGLHPHEKAWIKEAAEAYLESRELIALIDKARAIRKEATGLRQSRSAFIGLAAVNEARRVLAEVGK
jgi:hypothetical protein